MYTIFVQIASYRDDELPKTIASCLAYAAHPERLRFGIASQDGPETHGQIAQYAHDPRFRIADIWWRDSRGVGVARNITDRQCKGEDFYLQIDSHMRFAKGWDERLVAEWQRCNNPRAILSAYPPAFKYDDNDHEVFIESLPNRLIVHDMFMGNIPIFFGSAISGATTPQLAAFAAGGFQFGPGAACVEVPYEPSICFIGEEIVHSLRLFAAGYSIYAPVDQVVSHLYIRTKNQKNAHHFWQDFMDDAELTPIYHAMNKKSYSLVRRYLQGKASVSPATVRRFENFAGVDFARYLVHPATYSLPPLPMARDDAWRAQAIAPVKQAA